MHRVYGFEGLGKADLVVDAVYKGGTAGNAGDDPLHKLIGCGIQGGFRVLGSSKNLNAKLVCLYTSMADPDWPDFLDPQTGKFFYFGDNKSPGHLLHDTPRKGNILLRDSFEALHKNKRGKIPPFFVFTKAASGRDVIFKGIAVPGGEGISSTEDLVAIWKIKSGKRFQNYRSVFTILDIAVVKRSWIEDIKKGNIFSKNCPKEWYNWSNGGPYKALKAKRSVEYRTKEEQIPHDTKGKKIIGAIHNHFKSNPSRFEECAAELARLLDKNIISYDLTRPWVDGGRDAIGDYRIGMKGNSITVKFALEAKCYSINNSCGVKHTSRLISRLRYRQFGIFVTTSYIHRQAYKEIKEDKHPVIIISARDIVDILKKAGYSTESTVKNWLNNNFPI